MTENLRARDLMSGDARCIGAHESLFEASKMMRDLNVGCLPICGDNDKLSGMVTDRDIVLTCCAEDIDPKNVQAGTLSGPLYWTDADAGADEVLQSMEEHQVKRLPVVDSQHGHRLIGMISESDLARNVSDHQMAEFATRVYATA